MGFLAACKNEEDPIKNEGARVVTTLFINFPTLKGRLLRSQWWNLRKIQTHPRFYGWSCNLQEWGRSIQKWRYWSGCNISPIISLWGFCPDAQGQITHKSLIGSCRISNPFEILWLSLLPTRIKKNKSKMKELEWLQDFPHYNPMGAICC